MFLPAIAVTIGVLFGVDNADFFDTVEKQKAQGYEWHYTGYKEKSPGTKAISLRVDEGPEFVFWQLRKPDGE